MWFGMVKIGDRDDENRLLGMEWFNIHPKMHNANSVNDL